ncbi:MAG: hypothetical protein K2X27_18580 [Candidatus Obscuribacterales bacterium]|nr:hypothetical protein [Candidatus Obscuribacterales bacterium]
MQAAAKTKLRQGNTNKWSALFKSPLARSLMGGFFVIASIEAVFLAILGIDVLNADKVASHEFEMLRGSVRMSGVIQKAQSSFDRADRAKKDAQSKEKRLDFQQSVQATCAEMDSVVGDFKRAGFDTKGALHLRDSFLALAQVVESVLDEANQEGDIKVSFRKVLNRSGKIYRDFIVQIRAIHKALGSTKDSISAAALFGIAPQNILYIAAAVNILLIVLLLFLVEKGITGPISRLSGNCKQLKSGEIMPAPKSLRNEISMLEQSFHEMSLVLAENEKRRHSFLEFFQSVQSAALENVRICFDSLLSESSLQDRAKRNIQKARNNLNTLMQLLKSMTEALSFKSNNDIEAQFEKTRTELLLADAAAAVEALLLKRSIKLTIEGADYSAELDPHLIGRVLVNFLSNAIKYSAEGAEVKLALTKSGKNLRFEVIDRGPGISPEGQSKLFKEFSQIEAADGIKRSGTGLGLMICKQIVEAHGGEIGIKSAVGEGSTFWFEIPESASKNKALLKPGENEKVGKKKERRPGSLKRNFIVMLLLLLIPQTFVVLKLHSIFSAASENAKAFYIDKELLMRAEELLGLYLVWKMDIAKYMDAMEIDEVAKTQPILREQMELCNWILKYLPDGSQRQYEAMQINKGLRKLEIFGNYLEKHKDNLNLAAMPPLIERARKIAKDVDESLFQLMTLEVSGINKSYDGSQALRSELANAILMAALVNIALLAIIALVALQISEKISFLKSKAEDFAAGKELSAALKGNDELCYLDQKLSEAAREIKEADSQRQKLIAVINHDLRTPLSSIINGLQMILAAGYGEIGSREKELTCAAESELNKLLQQINDLLLIEKIDAGLYQLTSEKLELVPLLAATSKSLEPLAGQRGVKVVPAIEAGCRELCINGEKSLLEREFAIILANALQAAPPGSTVDVSIQREGNKVSILCSDHGPGINAELLPQIFERFRFVDGKPVSGLGLPLARRLSSILGGELEINSSSNGTQTRMSLPIAVT